MREKMEPLIRDRLTLAAVLGAGIVVGVSGLYLYFKYNTCVSRELTHLTRTIESLRKDIEELKTVSKDQTAGPSIKRPKMRNSDRHDAHERNSMLLGVSSSEENEEYFDVSEEGDANDSWTTPNGEAKVDSIEFVKDELTVLFEDSDKLLNGNYAEKQDAYERLMTQKEENISNPEFMWRLAKACSLWSASEKDSERQRDLIFEGAKYAGMALALDEAIGETHKWYAILMAKTTDHVSVQERLKNGKAVKEHIDIAIKLLPDDHTLYFIRGRWCYGVAVLSWIERKVATTIFGEIPESTFAEAREQFMQVERLKPGEWKENMLYIAKCYIEERNYYDAIKWLDKAAQLPCILDEDEIVQKEVTSLQSKYKNYRQNNTM